jgi:hypothetical protein
VPYEDDQLTIFNIISAQIAFPISKIFFLVVVMMTSPNKIKLKLMTDLYIFLNLQTAFRETKQDKL